MHVLHVVGARPNFMKVAPVLRSLETRGVRQTLVHTGQHYDVNLSDAIFRELRIPEPDINLGIGSGSHAKQTAEVLMRMEEVLQERRPDWLLVYGDINSTLAAALAASKIGVPIAHVEAGLRSGDRGMPEEINRILTDRLARLLFTPSADGDANLLNEGVPAGWIHCVGNVMIDTLVALLPLAESQGMLEQLGLLEHGAPRPFVLVTLHRPSNVDDDAILQDLLQALEAIGQEVPVVFPVHPRTRARIAAGTFHPRHVRLSDPLSYLQFLNLQRHAAVVITDSGGIQEETTYLGVPCLTMRENTERPVTVTLGTNEIIGRDTALMTTRAFSILGGDRKAGSIPPLWDGKASERIADTVNG